MRALPCAVAFALALSTLSAPTATFGQARDPATAEALFTAAREKMAAKDYAAACPMLAESQRLDPAAGTLLNLADCEEHIDQLTSAWAHWREAIAALPANDPALPIAKQRLEKIDQRLPRLTIRLAAGAPADARVKRDGTELGRASLGVPLPVNPGQHTVVVTAPSRRERQHTMTILPSERKDWVVDAGPEIVAPPARDGIAPDLAAPPVQPAARQAPSVQPSFWAQHKASILTVSAGAVLGGLGLGLAIKTLPDHAAWARECSLRQCTAADGASIRAEAIAANVLFAAAGAAAVSGVVVFFTVERPKKPATLEIGPQAAGARLTVRY